MTEENWQSIKMFLILFIAILAVIGEIFGLWKTCIGGHH